MAEQSVRREELLSRASSLLPAIRQRALATERFRQIPAETVSKLKQSGVLNIPTPQRNGGYEHDIDLMFEVAMTIGQACGSTRVVLRHLVYPQLDARLLAGAGT